MLDNSVFEELREDTAMALHEDSTYMGPPTCEVCGRKIPARRFCHMCQEWVEQYFELNSDAG